MAVSSALGQSGTTFQRTYGNEYGNKGNSIIEGNQGEYIIAGWYDVNALFSAEFYLLGIDSIGDTLWTRTYGEKVDSTANRNGAGNEGFSVVQTFDGGYLFTGEVHGFGAGTYDMYAVRLNQSLDTMWSKTYGGPEAEIAYSMTETRDTCYVLAGYSESFGAGIRDFYIVKIDDSGDTLWTRTIGGSQSEVAHQVIQTHDGGYLTVGYSFSFGNGDADVYAVKWNANGDVEWDKTFGGLGNDFGYSVVQNADSSFTIAGATTSGGEGLEDVLVTSISRSGQIQWTKLLGGQDTDIANRIKSTVDQGYILTGSTRSFGAGWQDVYLLKLNNAGEMEWSKAYGATVGDFGVDVIQSKDGGYITIGQTFNFGAGNSEIYVVKTDSQGNELCNASEAQTVIDDIQFVELSPNSNVGSGGYLSRAPTIAGNTSTQVFDPCVIVSNAEGDNQMVEFKLYPNPVKDKLFFNSVIGEALIYNSVGQAVMSVCSNQKIADVSQLPVGVYVLRHENYSEKFVIKR